MTALTQTSDEASQRLRAFLERRQPRVSAGE
jgi:hypothetical protein